MKMGTSLDKNDHPKSYYEKIYLEKMNAKNKRTRSNNIFGREYILNTKRERNDKKNKKDEDYVVEEDEESNSIQEEEEENNENENISIKSDESDQDTEGKKKPEYKFKRFTTTDIIEKNKNYKESGIKYTRLILMNKKKEKETKKYFINQSDNKNLTNISDIKKEESEEKSDELENEEHENNNNKESPLKQSKKYVENNNIKNNDISHDNKNDINLKVKDNYSSENKPISQFNQNIDINHISFGAPKTYEKNNNILLSNGPISFGFNQTTNSKNLGNTTSNKDNIITENKPKKYGTFVKNISEAVKENIKDSQNSNEKAKTILLKWESPRQKEFMSHSMDINDINNNLDNNLENTDNKINVEYDFNERIDNSDAQGTKLRAGFKNKNQEYSPYNNNYIKPVEKENIIKQRKYIPDNEENDNEYKNKLRSHNKNKRLYIEDNQEENNDKNYGKIIDNPFYTDVNKDKNAENEYTESQDIYGRSIPTETIYNSKNIFNSERDLNTNNNYYYTMRNDTNENNNMQIEENNQPNEEYMMMNNSGKNKIYNNEILTTPNAQNSNRTNINNNYYMTLDDKIKYYNEGENINVNAEKNNKYQHEQIEQKKRKSKFLSKISRMKNSVMNKFKNNKYIFPLLLLITFGIIYFLNNSYERFDNFNIIMVFSILIGLLILYNLLKYIKRIRDYKKMARADRIALLELLNNNNITRESLANHMMLVSNFISTRIEFHKLSQDEYMKYVFHYLKKYMKKDGFELNIEENNDNIKQEYWKEI